MQTTAGSYALVGSVVPRDAFVVQKLRDAKAVIIGKGSLSEWSGFRDLDAPGGWSARAIAAAANLVTVALGSETDGSILCPASANSVVGCKPTVGLTSRAGVIPISPRQDTVGAITRMVADAVHVLDIIAGTDPLDSATNDADKHKPQHGYKQHLISDGLSGKRLRILRTSPFFNFTGQFDSDYNTAYEKHFKTIKDNGGVLVDNLVIPNISTIIDFNLSGEKLALLAEFKIALKAYLEELTYTPVKSLSEIINFNKNNTEEVIDKIGQGPLLEAYKTDPTSPAVIKAISNLRNLSKQGFEKVINDNKLDALLIPGTDATPHNIFSIGGYPAITVPAGYDSDDFPFGLVFGGLKYTETTLIEIAYSFEQATLARRAPDVSAKLIRKVTDA
ncbi:Amidase family protein [Quillaja saponaria]|uniref:Amidase family protein n=1 Tax=Quillaja saponaria TaxID=32244 RepID=A0AAD7P569_QUISA|nr:Amidase family protein [Quillaja saponaria]